MQETERGNKLVSPLDIKQNQATMEEMLAKTNKGLNPVFSEHSIVALHMTEDQNDGWKLLMLNGG